MSMRPSETAPPSFLRLASPRTFAFGRRLRDPLRRHDLSQHTLGAAVGVRYTSQHGRGLRFPSVGKVLELDKALQASLDQPFGHVIPDEAHVNNVWRLRRFREFETLPNDAQETAVKLIDARVAKGKVRKVVP